MGFLNKRRLDLPPPEFGAKPLLRGWLNETLYRDYELSGAMRPFVYRLPEINGDTHTTVSSSHFRTSELIIKPRPSCWDA